MGHPDPIAFTIFGIDIRWYGILIACGMLLAVLICIALFMWALYGKSLDKLALKKNLDSKLDVVDIKKFAVGDKGVTRTRLALIGEAEFNGESVEVKSEMGYIKEGEPVEIIRIVGEAIYVKKVTNK